ncbi:ABC transporter substrate-binding protein [Miniimonas arenae]|uniref:ABC transporter substrate-binding protein n=1 Tax=Miniimonas arenae TaxID=676201 RepID=UPI0028B0DC42|nr:extracellular solute-binding protein [Miniimonas arenae]
MHTSLTTRTRRGALAAVGLAVAATVTLTACAPPGSGGTSDASSDAATEVSTDLGTDPVELVLYDGAGLKTIDDALIAAFTKEHPNVTITTRFDPDDVQAQNAPRVLAADDAPDIARVVALGDIVSSGLLTNLDPWADAYGWTDLPEGQLAMYRVDENGVRGSGSQYTLASGFVTTGLYVNTDLMAQLGIDAPPTTIEEWEADLATAKAAGVTPILAGNQTGQGVTTLQFLLNNYLGAQAVNDWVFNVADASIDTPDGVQAVQTVSDWIAAGYFNDDANGTDNAGAMARFVAGEGLFYPSGNWDAKNIGGQMDDVVFVSPPALEAGDLLAMSDPVSNFGIPAKSEHKDAAAAFLNFLVSDEARAILVENGFAPSGSGDAPATEAGSLNESVQSAFAALVEADGQVQFVQNATNGITQTWNAESQNLFGGKTTPEALLTSVQSSYEEELGR